jgi:hypothetical protein
MYFTGVIYTGILMHALAAEKEKRPLTILKWILTVICLALVSV